MEIHFHSFIDTHLTHITEQREVFYITKPYQRGEGECEWKFARSIENGGKFFAPKQLNSHPPNAISITLKLSFPFLLGHRVRMMVTSQLEKR